MDLSNKIILVIFLTSKMICRGVLLWDASAGKGTKKAIAGADP